MKTWIAEVFFSSIYYSEKYLQGELTNEGKEKLKEVLDVFKEKYKLDTVAKYDKNCGCQISPCSPGYKIFTNKKNPYNRESNERFRFNIWVNDDGSIDIEEPYYIFWFNELV